MRNKRIPERAKGSGSSSVSDSKKTIITDGWTVYVYCVLYLHWHLAVYISVPQVLYVL